MPYQQNWRYCGKCRGLFFDGYAYKGKCPAGGGHDAVGYSFSLPYNVPGTLTAQRDWEFCVKCHGMFFNGYPDKGSCPAGRGHEHNLNAYHFTLPHDVPSTPTAQRDWEYCVKCHGMFFNGYSNKGVCSAGGGHQSHPDAYHFVLPHPIFPTILLHADSGRREVYCSGRGFTPNHKVRVKYQYKTQYGFTSYEGPPLLYPTATNGSFTGVTLKASSPFTYFAVAVVDEVTGKEAVAELGK